MCTYSASNPPSASVGQAPPTPRSPPPSSSRGASTGSIPRIRAIPRSTGISTKHPHAGPKRSWIGCSAGRRSPPSRVRIRLPGSLPARRRAAFTSDASRIPRRSLDERVRQLGRACGPAGCPRAARSAPPRLRTSRARRRGARPCGRPDRCSRPPPRAGRRPNGSRARRDARRSRAARRSRSGARASRSPRRRAPRDSSEVRSRPTRRSTIAGHSAVAKFTRYARSPSRKSMPTPSASTTPRPGCSSRGSYPKIAKTAMSDSGAIPSPTVVTSPVLPCAASASRNGVVGGLERRPIVQLRDRGRRPARRDRRRAGGSLGSPGTSRSGRTPRGRGSRRRRGRRRSRDAP